MSTPNPEMYSFVSQLARMWPVALFGLFALAFLLRGDIVDAAAVIVIIFVVLVTCKGIILQLDWTEIVEAICLYKVDVTSTDTMFSIESFDWPEPTPTPE